MHALDQCDLRHGAHRKPIEEFRGRARIGATRARVANVCGEEFKEAVGGALAGGGDKGGGAIGGDGDELWFMTSSSASAAGAPPCGALFPAAVWRVALRANRRCGRLSHKNAKSFSTC
jgi:hypothetical protein